MGRGHPTRGEREGNCSARYLFLKTKTSFSIYIIETEKLKGKIVVGQNSVNSFNVQWCKLVKEGKEELH